MYHFSLGFTAETRAAISKAWITRGQINLKGWSYDLFEIMNPTILSYFLFRCYLYAWDEENTHGTIQI